MARRNQTDEPNTTVPITVEAAAESLSQQRQAELAERDLANQVLGRIQLGQGFQKLVTVTSLLDLQEMKNNKLYKHLTVNDGEKLVTVTSWEEFCKHLGRSREQIDEDLRNLEKFGSEALDSMQQMGLGYRELRKLRKLSDEEQQQLIQIVEDADKETFDKTEFLEMLDEQAAKHTREMDAQKAEHNKKLDEMNHAGVKLQKRVQQLEDLKESSEYARIKNAERLQEKINELDSALAAAERRLPEAEQITHYKPIVNEWDTKLTLQIQEFKQVVAQVNGQDKPPIELQSAIAQTINNALSDLDAIRHEYGLQLPEEAFDPLDEEFFRTKGEGYELDINGGNA